MIARDLDYEIYSSSKYKLITEDNIQKNISTNVFPEVPFLFQTQFSYLINMYKREYVQEEQTQREFEKLLLEMLLKDFKNLFIQLYLKENGVLLSPCIIKLKKKRKQ